MLDLFLVIQYTLLQPGFNKVYWGHTSHLQLGISAFLPNTRKVKSLNSKYQILVRLNIGRVSSLKPLSQTLNVWHIYLYIYRKHQPNVGKYWHTIHGWHGISSTNETNQSGKLLWRSSLNKSSQLFWFQTGRQRSIAAVWKYRSLSNLDVLYRCCGNILVYIVYVYAAYICISCLLCVYESYIRIWQNITHNGLSPCTSEHYPPFLLLPKQFHPQTNKFILLKSKGSRYLATWCTKRAKRDALLLCDRIPQSKTSGTCVTHERAADLGWCLWGVKGRYTHP